MVFWQTNYFTFWIKASFCGNFQDVNQQNSKQTADHPHTQPNLDNLEMLIQNN